MVRDNKFDVMQGNNKPEWNMAWLFMQRLDERLNDRDTAQNTGDLLTWYRNLRTIYGNIHWFVVQEGQEEAESKLIKSFEKVLRKIKLSSHNNNAISKASISDVEELLDDLNLQLNDLLFEYHLIFPKKHKNDPARALEVFS